jgi:GTP-binding protein
MKPTIALVGRPNVGKSTLFNRLTRTPRRAGRRYSRPDPRPPLWPWPTGASKPYLVVDTGGFEPVVTDGIMHEMARQTLQAVDEADIGDFCGGRPQSGMLPRTTRVIADQLRRTNGPSGLSGGQQG